MWDVHRSSRGRTLPCGSVRVAGRSEDWIKMSVALEWGKRAEMRKGMVSKAGYLPPQNDTLRDLLHVLFDTVLSSSSLGRRRARYITTQTTTLQASPVTPSSLEVSLSPEARRSGVRFGRATAYKRTMEHTATVIICKKNPNVSESDISPRTKV